MSNKRASKRRRDSGTPVQDADSSFRPSFPPKRSRSADQDDETSTSSPRIFQDNNSKRRSSSRTPKPKVLDNETELSSPKNQSDSLPSRPQQVNIRSPSTESADKSTRRSSRAPKPKKLDEDFIETDVRSPKGEQSTRFQYEASSPTIGRASDLLESQTKTQHGDTVRKSSRTPKPKRFDDEGLKSNLSSPRSEVESEQSISFQFAESSSLPGKSDKTVRKSSRAPKPKRFDDEGTESNLSSPMSELGIEQFSYEESSTHPKKSDDRTKLETTPVRKSSRAPKPKRFDDEQMDSNLSSPKSELANEQSSHFQYEEHFTHSIRPDDNESKSETVRKSSRVPKPKRFDDEGIDSNLSSPRSELDFDFSSAEAVNTAATFSRSAENTKSPKEPSARKSFRSPKPKILEDELPLNSKATSSSVSKPLVTHDTSSKGRSSNPKSKKSHHTQISNLEAKVEMSSKSSSKSENKTEGHKRETRRSYKDFLNEIRFEEESDEHSKSSSPSQDAVTSKSEDATVTKQTKSDAKKDIASKTKKELSHKNEPKSKRKSQGKEVATTDKGKMTSTSKSIKSPDSSGKSRMTEALQQTPEGSPKVKRSSRTPVPKRTFSLIDDTPGEALSPTGHSTDLPFLFQEQSPVTQKVAKLDTPSSSKRKQQSESDSQAIAEQEEHPTKKKKKKSKGDERKGKAAQKETIQVPELLMSPSLSSQSDSDRNLGKTPKSKTAKKKNEKKATKLVIPLETGGGAERSKETSKQKKKSVKESSRRREDGKGSASEENAAKEKTKHKHSKSRKTEQSTSEVKEEDQHIILKLHLTHQESPSHSPHKKHKHRHSAEDSHGSKKKKKRLSEGELTFSGESTDDCGPKDAKKISIKFKGLSSSSEKLEVVPEQEAPGKEKVEKAGKELEKKKKKKKAAIPSVQSGEEEKVLNPVRQEPVKLVIKKPKAGIEKSIVPKTPQRPQKEVKEKAKTPQTIQVTPERKATPNKGSASKKSKGSTSRKGDGKEKKRLVTGYLLFCKQERSKIATANPGLEFAQISTKVGIAWNSLPEDRKMFWRNKAQEIKLQMGDVNAKKSDTSINPSSLEPVDMAAHLKLLGESLSTIGTTLRAQEEMEVHGSLSVLLDSVLCAMCPLMFLTTQVEEINGCSEKTQTQILDDIAYIMPGLG